VADDVVVVTKDGTHPATHEQDGVWVAVLPGQEIPDYRIKVTYGDETTTVDDPYRYMPTLGEMDTYLISEGRHEELWEVLGAHVKRYDGPMGEVEGTAFAVWAPDARAVEDQGDDVRVGRDELLRLPAGGPQGRGRGGGADERWPIPVAAVAGAVGYAASVAFVRALRSSESPQPDLAASVVGTHTVVEAGPSVLVLFNGAYLRLAVRSQDGEPLRTGQNVRVVSLMSPGRAVVVPVPPMNAKESNS